MSDLDALTPAAGLDALLPAPGESCNVLDVAEVLDVPPVLLPYQQRWVADDSPVKVAEKSRRIGLSWSEAADHALVAASTKAAGGMDCFYIAYTMEMTQQFILDAAMWTRAYGLAATFLESEVIEEPDRDIQVYRIRFASGHRIEALSSKPRNLRSKQGIVTLDEAAFADDPEAVIAAGMAFLIWGGRVRIISTHNGWENAYNQIVQDIRADRQDYSLHTITLADAIADGLYERICLARGLKYSVAAQEAWEHQIRAAYRRPEDAAEELDCIPKKGSGKYFSRVLLEDRADPAIQTVQLSLPDEFVRLTPKERERHVEAWIRDTLAPLLDAAGIDDGLDSVYGFDFARSGDLSVLWPAQIGRDLTRRVLLNIELRNVPYAQQTQVCVYVGKRLPRFRAGAHDATGNGGSVAEDTAAVLGVDKIHEVKITAAWYADHFPRYRAGIEDQRAILPADSDVIDDHMEVEAVGGKPTMTGKTRTGSEGEQRHGDAAVAGCMMWFASEQEGEPAAPVGSTAGYGDPARGRSGLVLPGPGSAGFFDRFRRATGGFPRFR